MKLLCINQKGWKRQDNNQIVNGPKYMEEVTVDGVRESDKFYHLSEYPTIGIQNAYWKPDSFIPLSDKDETEYADEVLTRLFQPVKF